MASKRNGQASGWIGWLWRRIAGAGGGSLEEALRRLAELEEKVRQSEEWRNAPSIVIEQVRIDKVMVDKIEHHNNFGALGIKELGGRLNIGANYTLCEDKLPKEGAEGLEALRQARAAAQRDLDGSVGAGAVGSSGTGTTGSVGVHGSGAGSAGTGGKSGASGGAGASKGKGGASGGSRVAGSKGGASGGPAGGRVETAAQGDGSQTEADRGGAGERRRASAAGSKAGAGPKVGIRGQSSSIPR